MEPEILVGTHGDTGCRYSSPVPSACVATLHGSVHVFPIQTRGEGQAQWGALWVVKHRLGRLGGLVIDEQ